MIDVFFYEAFAEEEEALARILEPSVSCGYARETIQESGHSDPPSRLISVRTQSIVPPGWAGRIGGILSRTTGFDNLRTLRKAFPATVALGYLEEYATRAVAEHAIMMMFALLRRLPEQQRQFGAFSRDGLTGYECKGRKILIVGVGRIGYEIVSMALGLGMVVRGVDIVERHTDVDYVDKESGIAWADIVVCSMDLTPDNHGYFGRDLFAQAKPGILFINVARGEHAPLATLRSLLAEGRLGGLGLDVFEDEPTVAASFRDPSIPASDGAEVLREILTYPNVLCTPHNAFNTMDAIEGKAAFTVSQVHHFLKHGEFLWMI